MRILLTAFIAFWSTAAVAAISNEEMRDLAYAHDIEAAEAAMAQAHVENVRGEISHQELRALVDSLRTTHPDVVAFVDDWSRVFPNSPYPKTIQALQLNDLSWWVRGEKTVRETHPDALWTFSEMQRQAEALAAEAFSHSPDFLPASDALLLTQLSPALRSRATIYNVLNVVMGTLPNHRTLRLAARTAHPKWGGGGNTEMRLLCMRHADQVPVADYSSRICSAEMIFAYGNRRKAARLLETVARQSDHPMLLDLRLRHAVDKGDPKDREFVMNHLAEHGGGNGDLPSRFRAAFALDADAIKLLEDVDARMQADARAALPGDPFNGDILKILLRRYSPFVSWQHEVTPERKVWQRRTVVAHPFDPRAWRTANQSSGQIYDAQTIRNEDVYFINAIYYSNHGMDEVHSFLNRKMSLYRWYNTANTTGYRPDRRYLSAAEEEELLICPIVRLSRINEVLCADFDGPVPVAKCKPESLHKEALGYVMERVRQDGLCRSDLAAPVDALGYLPLPVDLGPMMVGIENRDSPVQ